MHLSRRNLLRTLLGGSAAFGMRALATGIPAWFLKNPRALAADAGAAAVCAKGGLAQYLILSTSGAGDPVNANAPGAYDFPDIVHAADPSMAATSLKLGAKTATAAQVWSTLPQWVLDRAAFFHHGTLTNSHPNHPKVLRLMGGTLHDEQAPSIYAKALAPCLDTIQTQPISVGAGTVLSFEGHPLPNINPTVLRDVLTHPTGPLAALQAERDKSLDEIHTLLKTSGTAAQKKFLDDVAIARHEAREISDDLLSALDSITTNDEAGQTAAAIVLIRMNVAPVMVVDFDFGGDNHSDPDLMKSEVPMHQSGMQAISGLMSSLMDAGLHDKVTFAMLNVFGRTLKKKGTTGRDHWGNHHVGVIMSSHANAGVIGGLEPQGSEYAATSIDSRTGAAVPGGKGDIAFDDSLGAFAKTLGAVLGVPEATLDTNITQGKVVKSAIAS